MIWLFTIYIMCTATTLIDSTKALLEPLSNFPFSSPRGLPEKNNEIDPFMIELSTHDLGASKHVTSANPNNVLLKILRHEHCQLFKEYL